MTDSAQRLELCPFCGKEPGIKVGPPPMVRCITDGCEGKKHAARTVIAWNDYAALRSSALPETSKRPQRPVSVSEYLDGYEFRGEGGDYTPTDNERELIEDAIEGYLSTMEHGASALPETMTYDRIKLAFDEYHKTLTVMDDPANFDSFIQGYVAGWNAKEASALPETGEPKEITMQDIRLVCGEGKLEARHVLNAVNIIIKRRAEMASPVARPSPDGTCDCGAATDGTWANVHSKDCTSLKGTAGLSQDSGRQAARGGGGNAEKAPELAPLIPALRHTSRPSPDGAVREALERCDWPNEAFTFRDEPGEHDPCYVVMPGGGMLALNHHAGDGVDIARAKFIVAACNAALTGEAERWFAVAKRESAGRERMSQIAASRLKTAPPSVALEAGREEIAKIETIVKLAVGDGEYIGRHCSSMTPKDVIDLRDRATAERLRAVRSALSRPQSDDANRGTAHSRPDRNDVEQ